MSSFRTTKVARVISLLVIPVLFCGTAFAADSPGKILADSKFDPKKNGFSFENWGGNEYPYSDLTGADARILFGDKVCARFDGDTCVPTPAAKLWLSEMNQAMKGGHCEGMAAMSAAFHVKTEEIADYGADHAFALKPDDRALMSTISEYFVTQSLEPVQKATNATRGWPLQKIIDTIISALKSGTDYPTLGIYGADGGHAITPYRVEQMEDGTYRVYIYDNNYPGAEKYVEVDTKKDHWVYAGAALNPKEDPKPWEGGAGAMDVTLLSSRYEALQCPFCGAHQPPKAPGTTPKAPSHPRKPSVQADGYTIVTPNRCSQVQATRKKDKKQLSGKKGAINDIGGATMVPMRGSRGCIVRLPKDDQYDIALVDDGRPYFSSNTSLVMFVPGDVYSVSNVVVSVTTAQTFSIGSTGFNYHANGKQSPTIRVAGDRAGNNGYYEVSGFTLSDGYNFSATEGKDGRISFHEDDPNVDDFDIKAEEVGEAGTETFDFPNVEVGENGQAMVDIDEHGNLDMDIDSDSDGLSNDEDPDDDNDNIIDSKDTDDDGDGTSDDKEAADFDHDSVPDSVDTDDDNDGVSDDADSDDKTVDAEDVDSDGDGIDNEADTDDDNDGTVDTADTDDDNDGISDDQDQTANEVDDDDDSDGDGVNDDVDTDDDNDGTLDTVDTDDDNDGISDDQEHDDNVDATAADADDHDDDAAADDGDDGADDGGDDGGDDVADDGADDGGDDGGGDDGGGDDGGDDGGGDDGGGDDGGGDDGGGDDGGGDE